MDDREILNRLYLIQGRLDEQSRVFSEFRTHFKPIYDNSARLLSVETKVDEMQKDIRQIKNGPLYSVDRAINKKIAKSGGILAIFLIFLQSITMI